MKRVWKWWWPLVLILAIAFVMGWQEERCQSQAYQCRAAYRAQLPSGRSVEQQAAEQQAITSTCEPDGYFCRLFTAANLPSMLLVFIGIAGVYAAVRTLRAIEEQVGETKAQRGVMGQQLTAMQGQLAQMESSGRQTDQLIAQATIQSQNVGQMAEAAQKSAKAAEENINLHIAKERAWLKIAIRPLVFPSTATERFTVDYEIHHYGYANALIVDSMLKAILTDSDDKPADTDLVVGGLSNEIVRPDHNLSYRQAIFTEPAYEFPTIREIEAVRKGPKVVHFWGFWIYDNGLGKQCTVKFRFRWKYDWLFHGTWQKYGDPEDNQET